ncbi:ATP-dependent nuclease [Raoultella planticola]|uniref:ATP-dependent nuclease n=1 Tax=Raoultella planticola TaxID=575 RepID=UPI001F317398|nr:ATP-binding protein [Raoultella planticola]MCE9858187.1 ATP-binding protein [Raoultella planticola]
MAVIRHISIQNFRTVRQAEWCPVPGLNCLIGPGDSGKSTIIDAIDLVLGARRSFPFSDADFHLMNTTTPICISITLGQLDDGLLNLEAYGRYFRGFNIENKEIHDEPQAGDETVLTLRMVVKDDLEPDWLLFSERTTAEGLEKRLQWKHREQLSPTRLGAASHHHLAWGNRSVLNKLSEEDFNVSATLAELSRQTRHSFAAQELPQLDAILTEVRTIANSLGVQVGELKALLDVNGVSLSNSAISLHNNDNTPLRMLGTGSTRLLVSGLQKAVGRPGTILIDEAEYGLEPYRISQLLHQLGSRDPEPTSQVFITTHSPYVLRELKATQLYVLRKVNLPAPEPSHIFLTLSGEDQEQATLRACAEAFFSKAVIVGEGGTEVGFIRGLDLYRQSRGRTGFQDQGAFATDGAGGEKYFKRAEVFARLGYRTALLKDSDIISQAHRQKTEDCRASGVTIFEWGNGFSTEGALLTWCPVETIRDIVLLAAALNSQQQVDQHIQNCSQGAYNFEACTGEPTEEMRAPVARAAGNYGWFKTIGKAEDLAENIVGPAFVNFSQPFKAIIRDLLRWAAEDGDPQ